LIKFSSDNNFTPLPLYNAYLIVHGADERGRLLHRPRPGAQPHAAHSHNLTPALSRGETELDPRSGRDPRRASPAAGAAARQQQLQICGEYAHGLQQQQQRWVIAI